MCQVAKVVDENILQLNNKAATEGAIKAQLVFFVIIFNLFKGLRLVTFIYFSYLTVTWSFDFVSLQTEVYQIFLNHNAS